PQIVDADIIQAGVLAYRVPTRAQLLQRLPCPLPGKDVFVLVDVATHGTAVGDQLQRRRAQWQPVVLALLGGGPRLDPKAGLRVELRPGGEHGLARTTSGQHDEPDAVSRGRAAIGVETLDHRRDLRRAQEPLFGLFRIPLNALARIALRLIAPRPVLAGPRLECEREHPRYAGKGPIGKDGMPGVSDGPVQSDDVTVVHVGDFAIGAELPQDV